MRKSISIFLAAAMATAGLLSIAAPAQAAPVVVEASDAYLDPSNTSRKIAVGANGDIFVLYQVAESGLHVARSIDGGASFGAGVMVVNQEPEAEIAISNQGRLYVTWAQGSGVYQKYSDDSAANWSDAIQVSDSGATSIHTAVDREYVYAIAPDGLEVFSSADSGDVWRTTALSEIDWAYSDVIVDNLSGRVFAFVDNPSVNYFYSDDRGATFSEVQETGQDVYFSVSAISTSPTAKYLFMVGGSLGGLEESQTLVRVNLITNQVDGNAVLDGIDTDQTRSIAADNMGNIVVGGIVNDELRFEVSNDFGASFEDSVLVQENMGSNTYGSIAINPTNGDVLALWQDGASVKFESFPGLLLGYDLNLDVAALDFDSSATKDIVLTNVSSSNIALSEISLASEANFTESTDCPASLAASETCTVTITAASEGTTILTIRGSGGIERFIPIAFGASLESVEFPTEEAGSGDQQSPAEPYAGPVVTPVDPTVAKSPGSAAEFVGTKLNLIQKVLIEGEEIEFDATEDSLSVQLPASIAAGTYDLVVSGSFGTLTIQASVIIEGEATSRATAGAWTSINDAKTTVRMVFKDPVGVGKVQFMVNGEEIAWVRAVDATDPKLRSYTLNGTEVPYLVRSVELKPDMKNVFEIHVDGERVWRAAYAG